MQKNQIILGTYNHLPEGSDESLFEETYQACWRPFLSVLYRFPDIFSAVYYSGTALRWLESRHPEFLMLLEEMVIRKQIEIIGGGFFAPLLPLVPSQDRLGQMEMLTTYIRKAFGKRPRGCWLADYAWEPGIASTLLTCGFDFTFLPERHFLLAGIDTDSSGVPVITEDQGRSIVVFPVFDSSESLPSIMEPAAAIESIRTRAGNLPLISIFYPGECFKEMWEYSELESPDVLIERSLAAIQRQNTEYETTTPSRFLRSAKHFNRAYFTAGASSKLMERSLPSRGLKAFETVSLTAGSPRRLLLRYGESLALYAKMQYVRILVGQLRGDKSRKKTAQEELWRGQCGDAYWPGKTGGIFRTSLRAAAYSTLIDAEKTTRGKGQFTPGLIRADIDFDGEKEFLYQGLDYNAYIHLHGACMTELDSIKTRSNYINLMEVSGIARKHSAFVDRFYRRGSFSAELTSLANAQFSVVDSSKPGNVAAFTREVSIGTGEKRKLLALRKTFHFRKGSIGVEYEIVNRESVNSSFRFVSEIPFTIASRTELTSFSLIASGSSEIMDSARSMLSSGLESIRMENRVHSERLELHMSPPCEFSHEPLYLHLEKDGCFPGADAYQGCILKLGWDLELPPEGTAKLSISLDLRG